MPEYHVSYSGMAIVQANTEDEAIKQAKQIAGLCAGFHAKQVGVDIDQHGWPLPPTARIQLR